MARLNTNAPTARSAPRPHKAMANEQLGFDPLANGNTPALSRKDSTTRTKGSSQNSKIGPGLAFDIFPDDDDQIRGDKTSSHSQYTPSGSPTKQKKKRTLNTSQVNSLLLPLQQRPRQRPNVKVEQDDYDKENDITGDATEPYTPERSPVPQRSSTTRNTTRTPARNRELNRSLSHREHINKDEDSCGDNGFESLDEFVVSDNDEVSYHETSDPETEEEKAPTPAAPPKSARKKLMRGRRPNTEAEVESAKNPEPKSELNLKPNDPRTIKTPTKSRHNTQKLSHGDFDLSTHFRTLELDDDNGPASQLETDLTQSVIEMSPPIEDIYRVKKNTHTPPSTPSQNRLRSPTKQKTRIPPTPHRENVDAFWSQEETIAWIDQHSPEKPLGRTVIELLQDFDDSETDDTGRDSTSSVEPRSTPTVMQKQPKTPSKTALKKAEAEKNRAVKARRLSFNNKKDDFAQTFLTVLDNAVAEGKVCQMAIVTGGVKITWSKTLQKTAGRAQWRGERIRDKDGHVSYKHHASIELAERIIDDEYRLINTLAHEYCHLANYMVSNVRDQPHGASFKQWGLKCQEALRDHPVYGGRINVTTKHSYKIDYKYVWACVGCRQTYGRHSKSIDPNRSRCGSPSCSGRLEQIKPKPRNVSPKKNAATPATQRNVMDNVAKELGGFTL
ncbi:hypothetical protein N7481_009876 [Penicillium waksmanii]|uniref:uncharacterized protein n=1 Tax=Penicillium waksmanii TaxID=69791 RepID=UPI002547921C|nr:uncharacterized protein N7481_009876 [Penicillium waksmanii]KAJ5976169.1 hypothetical protein N7481_009876 [Penicillium waksmanii]